jgi:hypothetical protein
MRPDLLRRVRGRSRALRRSIRSPGDALLAFRMAGWRLSVPLLKWTLPLPRLARLMWSTPRRRDRNQQREGQIMELVLAVSGRHGSRVFDNCLDRSLIAYRYLSRAGADPQLVVGVLREDEAVRGHTWIRVDGLPFQEPAAALEGFEEMTAFGPEGALIPSGAPSGAPATRQAQPDPSQ